MTLSTTRPYPSLRVFEGRYIRLEPLDLTKHLDGLASFQINDEERFRFMFQHAPKSKEELRERLSDESAKYYYIIIDKASNNVVGRIGLFDIDPENGSAEIGVYFSSLLEKKSGGTEAIYLILKHLFEEMNYRR